MTTIRVQPRWQPARTDASFVNPLTQAGAAVILGGGAAGLPLPLAPSPTSLFGPRGLCLVSETGPLWVADTGHHRLLGWRSRPTCDQQPADWVIGQPDFFQEGQNANGCPSAASVSVPTGICASQTGANTTGLVVADAWNHRVLIWHHCPEDHNVPADLVLGQASFDRGEPNRGFQETAGDRLHWCYGVMVYQNKLFVADTGNRRVLIWNTLPQENGQPADLVLGQPHLHCRDGNGGGEPTAASLRWCHSFAIWHGHLVVADAGNNRILIWDGIPTQSNAPCAVVLGQPDFTAVEINQGAYLPTARSLNMPYGITVAGDWLLVSDTANSRLLGWRYPGSLDGLQNAPAQALVGQTDFQSKGENRVYGTPSRDSLCWPYAVQGNNTGVAIADSGNNRILLWNWR